MQTENTTNTVYVDGIPRHCGKDVQALMALAKSLYAHAESDIVVCCPEYPEHSGRQVWMRFDRFSGTWVETSGK